MSTLLANAIESLHITAARKLIDLIQAETDPTLLVRLLAIAARFKVPKPAEPSHPAPPAAPNPEDSTGLATHHTTPPTPPGLEAPANVISAHPPGLINARRESVIEHLTRTRNARFRKGPPTHESELSLSAPHLASG